MKISQETAAEIATVSSYRRHLGNELPIFFFYLFVFLPEIVKPGVKVSAADRGRLGRELVSFCIQQACLRVCPH